MTPEQAAELVLLRRHFGLSAEQVYRVLPAWEVELLAAAVTAAPAEAAEPAAPLAPGPRPDPFADVPDHLMNL